MKIILISQYYWPESFGAGVWHAELAERLAKQGHDVTVITGFPNYPDGVVFPEYRGRRLQREEHNGVRIIRTWLHATPRTKSLWQRVLSQASFSVSLLLGIFLAPRADVVWYESPPLPGTITSWTLARLHGARFALTLADLEPERSVALGLFKNHLLVRMLESIERFAYGHADRICILSEGTKQRLVARGVSADKIRVTPNWADGNLIVPLPQEASLRAELGVNGEFVVLYSGNMGYTMGDLETVVDAARMLSTEKGIRFLLAGDGVRRDAVQRRAQGLPNVTFLPIQPRDRFARLLATGDVGLVLLCAEGTYASVPSKTYSIMASGRPIIAVCEPDNDTARVVHAAGCGELVVPGDATHLADVIQSYFQRRERAKEEGKNARAYFDQHYCAEVGISNYERVFSEIAASTR